MSAGFRRASAATAAAALLAATLLASGTPAALADEGPGADAASGLHSVTLADGSIVRWADDGTGSLTDKAGRTRIFPVPQNPGRTGLGAPLTPTAADLQRRVDAARLTPFTLGAPSGLATSAVRPRTMNYGAVPIPGAALSAVGRSAAGARSQSATPQPAPPSAVPANEGLTTSFQSYLNAGGVNAIGAFQHFATYLRALPGAGQIITNVSLGDLTDQSMADAGDDYVRLNGPTTIVKDGQRYLDYPSMPLIPTYTADKNGRLDPTGAIEGQDPNLGEVLMDFTMMAPLPHDRQRPEAMGSGPTDLLGIAPGAGYRLVIPQEPSIEGIDAALRAAAAQRPRPTVITASLGFGTDGSIGFPSRWLEESPEIRRTLRDIVDSGIVVVVSSNDGTRLGLPVSIGPDGGSTPTDLTRSAAAETTIDDVAATGTPTLVRDTGVISAGGSTLDDTLTSADVRTATYPTTRYNGAASYSSGFGTRVDLAAPGDNLPTLMHTSDGTQVVLNGGTSASAPIIAAAAANVLSAAKATGQKLTPRQVRDLLIDTGRPLAQPPQADQELRMGPQLDVTAAVERVLGKKYRIPTAALRLSVAHRQLIATDVTSSFVEATDPANVDLTGPASFWGDLSGQNVTSPITFGLDMTGDDAGLTYRLRVGDRGRIPAAGPSLRVLPAEIFAAAGLPLEAAGQRTVPVVFEALRHGKPVAAVSQSLTFSAADGTHTGAPAPVTPGSIPLGKPLTVQYDLSRTRDLADATLVLSSVGHWTPLSTTDKFRVHWSTPLTGRKGSVTIPASAFGAGGAGIYGVGVRLNGGAVWGDFRAVRVGEGADRRPEAPLVAGRDGEKGHSALVTLAAPKLKLSWDVSDVRGADGAAVEFLTPGPTLYGSLNTTTNQNGSGPDDNGVDHASTLVRALPGAKGTTTLDLAALRLTTSTQYPVRVLPTRGGRPIGQASPTSFVEYRDGESVTGALENFEVNGKAALIATDEFAEGDDGWPHVKNSATTPYSLTAGRVGTPLLSESGGSRTQSIVGSDPATGRTLIARRPFDAAAAPQLDLRDTATGKRIAEVSLQDDTHGDQTLLEGGVVDTVRHRAALTTFDARSGLAELWTLDMATGKLGAPIPLNPKPENFGRTFRNVSFDAATGAVFAATGGTQGPCLNTRVPFWAVRVDLDARTVSPVTDAPRCTAGFYPDGKGAKVYMLAGAVTPDRGAFPTSTWTVADQATLTGPAPADLGTRGPAWAALDEVNHLAVIAHLYEAGTTDDNNALSEITVIEPGTGKVVARHPVVNLVNSVIDVSNVSSSSRQGLYLDPSTRTGYVVNPWADGLQRFRY
ncbi:S8 family serine peptidase [Sphaerisporangium dianthi]|uniref:S8 family serine peptidase n=1 Tax=Sphaerisporangium dianthi TaxID=1436120 RepID=A0ABV9CRT8_9ACTN